MELRKLRKELSTINMHRLDGSIELPDDVLIDGDRFKLG
jgi:hypothetical protein